MIIIIDRQTEYVAEYITEFKCILSIIRWRFEVFVYTVELLTKDTSLQGTLLLSHAV